MAGILDLLMGNNAAASPWGALYPTQTGLEADQAQQARDAAAAVLARRMRGGPGVEAAPALPDFGAGATPFGFAGPGSMTGINPAMLAPPAAPAPAAPQVTQAPAAPSVDLSSVNRTAPAPAAPDEGPDSFVPVGKYQMPMFGEPGDAPQAAAPAAVRGPGASAAPFSLGGAGFGDRLNVATQSMQNTHGLIPKLFNGVTGFATGQRTDSAAQQQNATAQALVQKGASPADVQAAANNPSLMTALIQQYYGKDKYKVQQTGEVLGQKTFKLFNETDGTFKDIPGSAGGGAGGAGGAPGLLAPGVQYDPNKSGDAYFGQFSPEVQAAAKAYINGDVMPTGNARKDSIATLAKTVAQKYGQDIGIPVSDTAYAEKRKYRTELGSTSANTAGGQAKAFNQGIDHLSSLAKTLEKLDNSNGLGIPMVAGAVNSIRQGVSNEQSAISDEAKSLGQTVAGEVGKLFSGSAGGGVHERELTRERFDTVKSRPQLAAALQATIETMQGGLSALEQRRNAVLGPDSSVELVDNSTRQKIAQIQGVIDRLKGGGGSAPAGGAPRLQPGQSTTIGNVSIKRVN